MKKLEQQLKKLLGFDPSPFEEVNVCLVLLFLSFSPGRCVDVFFPGVLVRSIFFVGRFCFKNEMQMDSEI